MESPVEGDLGGEVADLKLLPGEKVVRIDVPDIKPVTAYPVSVLALERLTEAKNVSEVGLHGPSMASRVSEANVGVEELRKFEVLFGRDSLRVALDISSRFPNLLRATIEELARLQGVEFNVRREEEPGRIIHESRDPKTDPIAVRLTKEHGWQWPFYASVDATPSFVIAIARYVKNNPDGINFLKEKFIGRDGKEHSIEDSLASAVSWIKHRMDSNQEGLVESKAMFEGSHENQVWKDSWDSYHHKDGTMASHTQGIASVEVQALTYDALLNTAELYEMLGKDASEISDLRQRAEKLKKAVMDNFWIEDERGGYFVLGTDRDDNGKLRPLQIRTSNMGHLLNSKILDGEDPEIIRRREAVIRTLFSPEMLAAGGIKTLSSQEVRFRPGSYHNGSVWLWDTYYISQGLERHGYPGLSWELNRRIWSVVRKFKKFPEFVRGGMEQEPIINTRVVEVWDDNYKRKNRIEQPPQEIQAWSVAAIFDIKFQRGKQLLKRTGVISEKATEPSKAKLEQEILSSMGAPVL